MQLKDSLIPAIGFASLNALMLAAMSMCAKLLATYFGPLEVTIFRNIISLAALFAWLFFARQLFVLKTERPWAHLFRGAIGTAGIVLGMWAVSLLSLAETTVLLFTSPLFTTILSVIFLKERIGLPRIAAVLCGFMGVIIVAAPWGMMNGEKLAIPLLGLAVGLGWGFFSGSVDACLRWIGTTEKSTTTVFYFALFGTIATALHWPFATIHPDSFSSPALMLIVGIGVAGLISLLAKTQSFRLGKASTIAPIMYTMIIWTTLFDYLFWDKIPTWNVIAGACIIIVSNLFILYRENRKPKANKPAADING